MTLHRRPIGTWTIIATLMLAALPAFARTTREIRIERDTALHGQALPLGTYSLSWKPNGNPNEVELAILRGKKVLASATAKLMDRETQSDYDSITYRAAEKGTREIVEIRFAGKKQVIRVEE